MKNKDKGYYFIGIIAILVFVSLVFLAVEYSIGNHDVKEDKKETLPYDIMFYQYSDYVGDYIPFTNHNVLYHMNDTIAGILLEFDETIYHLDGSNLSSYHNQTFLNWNDLEFNYYADEEFVRSNPNV